MAIETKTPTQPGAGQHGVPVPSKDPTPPATIHDLEKSLKRLERRDWSLWITATTVMMLLMLAVWVVPVTETLVVQGSEVQLILTALLGMVLLFAVFSFYQQVQIKRLRRHLADQIASTVETATRAEMFEQLAILDPLTGLYNRRFLEGQLPIEIARASRHGYPLSVLAMDIDGLKALNDRSGHAAGDHILAEFARRLKLAVRNSDIVVRLGGDEFIVVLPECAASAVPRSLARLRSVQIELGHEMVTVGFSSGWVEYQEGDTPQKLLQRADDALYQDKQTHKAQHYIRQTEALMADEQKLGIIGKMTGGIVHHFNNLLTVITGHSQLLKERLAEDPPSRHHLHEIDKAVEQASALSSQLIAFARHRTMRPASINLNDILVRTEPLIGRTLGGQVEIRTTRREELGYIHADEGQLQQVLLNLVLAARDAVQGMSRLVVEVENFEFTPEFCRTRNGARPGQYIHLQVRAAGESATRDSQALDPATMRQPLSAAHLGLSVIYGAVKQHGGYLWVEPSASEVAFNVYFPRLSAEAMAKTFGQS